MSDSKNKKKRLLVDGNIPAHTECFYRNKCEIAESGNCRHLGLDHPVAFSCAAARSFEVGLPFD